MSEAEYLKGNTSFTLSQFLINNTEHCTPAQ